MSYTLDTPFAHGGPLGRAAFRQQPEDFIVQEELGFAPEGDGEHHYLHLQKRGVNTDWVAQKIARLAGVKPADVGFCGLKDRHGVADQWFSVYLPKGNVPDWHKLEEDAAIKVLSLSKGRRKLRRGQHASNRFVILLRNVSGTSENELQERLLAISKSGVPNYFGEQRFGRNGSNLVSAKRWLEDGVPLNKMSGKSMIMSAARSHLFNCVVAERVRQANWNTEIPGDVLLEGTPTGPLWGRGRSRASDEALVLEQNALAEYSSWLNGLEHCGLSQERRSIVLSPVKLDWALEGQNLRLSLDLLPGEFATAVLREVLQLDNLSA
jgi:tRNA pseudouridine13 synthase